MRVLGMNANKALPRQLIARGLWLLFPDSVGSFVNDTYVPKLPWGLSMLVICALGTKFFPLCITIRIPPIALNWRWSYSKDKISKESFPSNDMDGNAVCLINPEETYVWLENTFSSQTMLPGTHFQIIEITLKHVKGSVLFQRSVLLKIFMCFPIRCICCLLTQVLFYFLTWGNREAHTLLYRCHLFFGWPQFSEWQIFFKYFKP